MDRGIPTEAVLAEMRSSDPPVQYLVGTPKGRLSRLEKQLLAKPWQEARPGVSVKLLAEDDELYVFADRSNVVSGVFHPDRACPLTCNRSCAGDGGRIWRIAIWPSARTKPCCRLAGNASQTGTCKNAKRRP